MKSEAPNQGDFTLAKPAVPVYPWPKPQAGVLTEIAPGILCLRMPFPIALGHINLFLLKSGEDWQLLIGHGHSPEHAMLYCAKRSVLISGDQLLPTISTNISVTAIDPTAEPLSEWLTSLKRLLSIPDDTLVLPVHGLPFRGIGARIAQLQAHHALTLSKTLSVCSHQSCSAYQVSQRLFAQPMTGITNVLALGESLAHLHHLVRRGELTSTLDPFGVRKFQLL